MKESKGIVLYMNNKRLEKVQTIRYIGIIIDSKINFREHILCTSQVYKINTHIIKVGKTETGLSHGASHIIYNGAILLIMTYGIPVWIKALEKECNRKIYNRV
jgi:hypothetical protein